MIVVKKVSGKVKILLDVSLHTYSQLFPVWLVSPNGNSLHLAALTPVTLFEANPYKSILSFVLVFTIILYNNLY